MATFVLVHGHNMSTETWNKLTVGDPIHTDDGHLGGKYWDGTVSALKAHKYRAFAPTLKDEHRSNLTDHIEQICTLIDENDLKDVILVGHSYGGMVITGVAARIHERIRRLVYVDAALPDPGQSLFDLIAACGFDPTSFARLGTAPPFLEKLQYDPRTIESLPKTFILCTKSKFSSLISAGVARKRITTGGKDWTYVEMPASHMPMADMPDEFYRVMLDSAKE